MIREHVKSSSVVSVGYDPRRHVLEIEYEGGEVYDYFDVPKAIYDELMRVESRGIYVNLVVKPRFKYQRVGQSERSAP